MSQKPSKIAKSKKSYPPEFREKAVRLVTELGYTVEQVAEKLGCSKESVRRWKDAVKPTLDPDTLARMELDEDVNKRLRKEVARLKMENDILKKGSVPLHRSRLPVLRTVAHDTDHNAVVVRLPRCNVRRCRLDRRTSKTLARHHHV